MIVVAATFGALSEVQMMHSIYFQRSGSQQSNASNDAQFGVETKKLQPLQANHFELKEAFCKVLRNHPFAIPHKEGNIFE